MAANSETYNRGHNTLELLDLLSPLSQVKRAVIFSNKNGICGRKLLQENLKNG